MVRKPIKVLSNGVLEYIHPKYEGMDKNAPLMEDRPLIITCKRLSRDQRFLINDLVDIVDVNGKQATKGNGKAIKELWFNNVISVKNVLLQEEGKEPEKIEELKDISRIWDANGEFDEEILGTAMFIIENSRFTEKEEKN